MEQKTDKPDKADPTPELRKLVELATKYPEVGPPLADLAYKMGHRDIGDRVVRMGLDGDTPGIEFHFVVAHAAKREKRHSDVLQACVDAVLAFMATPEENVDAEDASRLLHLVRMGFATLMFDLQNIEAEPEFARQMNELLPRLDERLGKDPFYRTLLAQSFWFHDKEKSEAEWDKAAELDDTEMSWNARGTWYREAEKDNEKAERAYRKGLKALPESPLLLHNVAQILVELAAGPKVEPNRARNLLAEADELLRTALRADAPRVRRHIHATRDRLNDLRRNLPRAKPRPDRRDDRRKGPKARPKTDRGKPDTKPPKRDEFLTKGKVSLGDMLLAKLEEKKPD